MTRFAFIILNIFIVIVLSVACDKNNISDIQQQKFLKIYGFSDDDSGSDVVQLDDGSYAMVGTITTLLEGKDMCFIRTDEFGNSISAMKMFGGRFDDYGTKIRLLDDGGFLIMGTRVDNIDRDKDVFLVRLDSEGNEVWEKTYGSSADDEAFDMLIQNDGSIVLTGYSDSLLANSRDMMIAKISQNGNLQWLNLIGYRGEESGNCIIESDGGFLIVGTTNSRPVGTTVNNIMAIKTNEFGTGFLPTTFASDGNTEGNHIEKIGNQYLVLGTAYEEVNDTSSFTALKLDQNLHLLSEVSFGEGTICKGSGIITTGNEEVIIYGTTQFSQTSQEISLVKTSLSLTGFEYHYFGGNSVMEARGIAKTSDDGYIMTGLNKVNEKSSIVLLKVDEQLNW